MGRFERQAASVRFRLARAGLHRNRSQSLLPSPLGRATAPAEKPRASRVQRGSLLTPLPRRSRGRACDTPVAIAATSAERTEGAARAEASLLALCRVATEEDGVNVGNAASGSAESITLR